MMRETGAKFTAFARSMLLIALIVVAAPWGLTAAARARFGGGSPLHGVGSPSTWSLDSVTSALGQRLTDATIADIVIRLSLVIAWIALVVTVLTIVAETVHMVRHQGLALPDVRGLGLSQRVARVIAVGLLVVIPMLPSTSRAGPDRVTALISEPRAVPAIVAVQSPAPAAPVRPPESSIGSPTAGSPTVAASADALADYVVRAGDSIYGIAERLAASDGRPVIEHADELLDLNLGREMPGGQRFDNAAYIEVGWVLRMPDAPSSEGAAVSAPVRHDGAHVVEQGESLWSIADDELGAPERWPEIFEANQGRTFGDGRSLTEPSLIRPGWDLAVPGAEAEPVADPAIVEQVDTPVADRTVADVQKADVSRPVDDDRLEVGDRVGGAVAPGEVADTGSEHARVVDAGAATPIASEEEAPVDARRPRNEWHAKAGAAAATPVVSEAPGGSGTPTAPGGRSEIRSDGSDDDSSTELLTFGRAAMLSAGVLTLLAVRRRSRLRGARPRSRLPRPAASQTATERALRAIDPGERFARVDVGVRAAAMSLIECDQRVLAVLVAADGSLELFATGPVDLPGPWEGTDDRWRLPGSSPIELLADEARRVGAPCPTLVQLGSDSDHRDVYVDLEAIGSLEIGGSTADADAIVAAIATTLAGSVLAEVTTLVGLGVADEAFLGHRHHVPVTDIGGAYAAVGDAVGSTATMSRSTFELRARGTGGETWEPAVVLVGSSVGTVNARAQAGTALVSAAPIHGPSSRLAPEADSWMLRPCGIELTPIRLTPDDVGSIADLVSADAPALEQPSPPAEATASSNPFDQDHTIIRFDDAVGDVLVGTVTGPQIEPADESTGDRAAPVATDTTEPDWALLVRLLGPVEVVARSGDSVEFERSKTRELIAWLATHRERSTRVAARTALWELDVRDATFANVVSEARRSLARLVEPAPGHEWVGRTMTGALPLHEGVLTDADLVTHALDVARVQPPAQAIATLRPVVGLITGMPFEGTSYLWPDSEGITSSLVMLATTAASELAAHCLSVGDVAGVFDATGRGLRVLPGHEELIGLRMSAHARAGDHAGVRHEWECYERVVTADDWSDGEPSPKLVDLRRRLLEHR